MKRVLGLVVLFVVLSVCVPSYGYFLIYNISATVKGADDSGIKIKISVPVKGFMVVTLNGSDDITDTNVILYGKDASSPKKQPKYFEVDQSEMSVDNWIVSRSPEFYFFLDVQDTTGDFSFEGFASGKITLKDVGVGIKPVTTSMKGTFILDRSLVFGPITPQEHLISGSGNLSMTLNNSLTKTVNSSDDPVWDANSIINGQYVPTQHRVRGIIPDLEKIKYTRLVLP